MSIRRDSYTSRLHDGVLNDRSIRESAKERNARLTRFYTNEDADKTYRASHAQSMMITNLIQEENPGYE